MFRDLLNSVEINNTVPLVVLSTREKWVNFSATPGNLDNVFIIFLQGTKGDRKLHKNK